MKGENAIEGAALVGADGQARSEIAKQARSMGAEARAKLRNGRWYRLSSRYDRAG